MEVLHPRCAGLDVHKDMVVACARVAADGQVQQDVRSFQTTTSGLMALSDWLSEHQIARSGALPGGQRFLLLRARSWINAAQILEDAQRAQPLRQEACESQPSGERERQALSCPTYSHQNVCS